MTISNRTLILGLTGLSLAIIVTGTIVGAETGAQLFEEGGIIETLTAALYGLAGLIALGAAIFEFSQNDANRHAYGLVFLALLSAFLVAEEISIWAAILNTEPPRILGIRMDAAHDVLHLGLKFLKVVLAWSMPAGLALIGLIVLTGAAMVWRFGGTIVSVMRRVVASRTGLFLTVCFALGGIALVADLRSETWPVMKFIEEGLELSASLSLVLAICFAVSMRAFDDPPQAATLTRTDI